MRIFFYAPFKPLGHPHPSGDLAIATGLYGYLAGRGAIELHDGRHPQGPMDFLEALVLD